MLNPYRFWEVSPLPFSLCNVNLRCFAFAKHGTTLPRPNTKSSCSHVGTVKPKEFRAFLWIFLRFAADWLQLPLPFCLGRTKSFPSCHQISPQCPFVEKCPVTTQATPLKTAIWQVTAPYTTCKTILSLNSVGVFSLISSVPCEIYTTHSTV